MMSDVKVLVFDIGGVLVRIHHDLVSAILAVGWTGEIPELKNPDAFNVANRLYHAGSISRQILAMRISEQLDNKVDLGTLLAAHDAILREEYTGAAQVVKDVQAIGVKTAVLSNTCASHWGRLAALSAVSLASKDHCFLSFEMGLVKPDDLIYQSVEESLGLLPHEIAFVDDSLLNVEAAKKRGWVSASVPASRENSEELRQALVGLGLSL
ncbi:MAG: HAD-IA family hydrolase [Deltaproteobacteria bacterium]|nr:HAD-IA family hydrolase [Deltaproteobacteria bacterium]